MPSSDLLPVIAALAIGLLAAARADAPAPAGGEVPARLLFRFGEVTLVREEAYRAATVVPVWRDAQRPPPAGFEARPLTVLLSAEDVRALWPAIRVLDQERLARLTDADFQPGPPDLHRPELLRLEIDGRAIVSVHEQSRLLRPELRRPLQAIADRVRALHEARQASPVRPRLVELRLVRPGAPPLALTRTAEATEARAGDGRAVSVAEAAFEEFWDELMREGVLDGGFGAAQPAPAASGGYELSVQVDGFPAASFGLTAPFEGQQRLDRLHARLARLARP